MIRYMKLTIRSFITLLVLVTNELSAWDFGTGFPLRDCPFSFDEGPTTSHGKIIAHFMSVEE